MTPQPLPQKVAVSTETPSILNSSPMAIPNTLLGGGCPYTEDHQLSRMMTLATHRQGSWSAVNRNVRAETLKPGDELWDGVKGGLSVTSVTVEDGAVHVETEDGPYTFRVGEGVWRAMTPREQLLQPFGDLLGWVVVAAVVLGFMAPGGTYIQAHSPKPPPCHGTAEQCDQFYPTGQQPRAPSVPGL